MEKRNSILSKVSEYINEYLDPSKKLYQPSTIKHVLSKLQILEENYYWALSISTDSHYQIHLKRETDSCFVNDYNRVLLKAWQANMDLEPVYNYYKAISYMTAYFSNSGSETSEALKQVVNEMRNQNLKTKEAMRKLSQEFVSARQLSVQEAVYLCPPELWLRKCFPRVTFINTSIPNDGIRILKSETELHELNDDSTDIFKAGIIETCCQRVSGSDNTGKNICLAEFATWYTTKTIDQNDYQPSQLPENVSFEMSSRLPEKIYIQSVPRQVMKKRTWWLVLRYYLPNKALSPEKYAHSLLILFLPFSSDSELLKDGSYCHRPQELNVLETVRRNRRKF